MEAFATRAARKKLLQEYIEHCKNGFSDECFPPCAIAVFNALATVHPEDFPSEAIARAKRERQLFWEKLGITGALGKIRGFNAAAWKSSMEKRSSREGEEVSIFTKLP